MVVVQDYKAGKRLAKKAIEDNAEFFQVTVIFPTFSLPSLIVVLISAFSKLVVDSKS